MSLIVTFHKSNEVLGGVQILFDNISKGLNVRQLSWEDAMNCGKIKMSNRFYRYVIFDRMIFLKNYLTHYQRLFNPEFIISDDCCINFKMNTNLITLCGNPYYDIGELYAQIGLYDSYFEFKEAYTDIQKRQLLLSEHIVANSKYMQDYVKRLTGKDSFLIENGVDSNLFKPLNKEELRKKYNIPLDSKVGIWCGIFHPVKNWYAIHSLVKKFTDIEWILVFKIPTPGKHLLKNVHILSNINQDFLAELYSLSDFCINISPYESFGLIPVEAGMCNTPSIVSKAGWAWDMNAGRYDFGYVIDSKSNMKEIINSVLNDSFTARDFMLKRGFTVERMIEDWKRFINSGIK